LSFQAFRGLAGLEQLAPQWTVLAESIPGASFNHFPGWYRAYLASRRSDPDSVWFIAAYRNGRELAAIAPLQYQSRRIRFLHPRLLGTVDDDELQLSDFIFAPTPDNSGLVYELVRWLRRQRQLRWDQLRILKISDHSSFAFAARSALPTATLAEPYDGSAWFDTRGTYEQATQAMSAKFRSNLRRRARLAASSAPLRFQCYRQPQELDEGFNIFLEVEASGWKGTAGTSSAIRCRPAVLAFYTEVVRQFAPRNECVINVLWHGDQAIASQFGLRIGTTVHILKIGYRDELAQYAPGIVLQEMTLRHACEDPDVDILSLVNAPPWAASFRPLTVPVWIYRTPNWSTRGLLAHLGLLVWQRWKTRTGSAAEKKERQPVPAEPEPAEVPSTRNHSNLANDSNSLG
jgi:CelD/BcsL family acetyltransferase involved in cellulose biosynthesis